MKNNLIEVCMHPIRQRILQYIALHEKATTTEISLAMTDIAQATLYRHIKTLLDVEALEVVEETTVRGAIKRTYAIRNSSSENLTNEDTMLMVQSALSSIGASFGEYFAGDDIDPVRDMLSVSQTTILMDDAEFLELLKQVNALFVRAMENKPTPERKQRRVSILSIPEKITKEEK